MKWLKPIAKAALKSALESFASAAGTHVADRLLQKDDCECSTKEPAAQKP